MRGLTVPAARGYGPSCATAPAEAHEDPRGWV